MTSLPTEAQGATVVTFVHAMEGFFLEALGTMQDIDGFILECQVRS